MFAQRKLHSLGAQHGSSGEPFPSVRFSCAISSSSWPYSRITRALYAKSSLKSFKLQVGSSRVAAANSFPGVSNRVRASSSSSLPAYEGARIKVIGVGGGGNNAVNRMIGSGLQGRLVCTLGVPRLAVEPPNRAFWPKSRGAPPFRGISALYKSASSSITIGGHVGRIFQLSRSVRQGCPLAPYLFFLVAETMSDFMRAQQPALRGLLLPVVSDLLDQEYADDTLLFLHYFPDVLDSIQYALEVFCVDSGARINWVKSYGILAGSDDVLAWGPGDFAWLRSGETCRYLGFQVRLNVTPEQQFSPVMQSMRRKLCYWFSQHLSLAGRALVANQVLSAWYVVRAGMRSRRGVASTPPCRSSSLATR
ncbi:hypothetical protein L7F22_044930 [Adiantum nelumboides]|nr:hypothetical protein [Adiantum nelumboides]